MSFAYDREKKQIIDPETGDVLKQMRRHYQDLCWYQTIFGPDGRKTFAATVLTDADGSLANPRKKGDHVLTSAVRYDSDGGLSEVSGRDPDLRRIIEYIRARSDPEKPFSFSDARHGHLSLLGCPVDYRFAIALGVIALVGAVGWKLADGSFK